MPKPARRAAEGDILFNAIMIIGTIAGLGAFMALGLAQSWWQGATDNKAPIPSFDIREK